MPLHAQESEAELNEKALALFQQEDFEEASKLYSTLLSISMQNPEYNYRFGVCQLYTIQDKEEPLKYLKFATEQADVPPLAYFYYGLGLHLNYRFDKAIEQYNTYKPLASKKESESSLVDLHIKQCKQGKDLVSSFTDISVVQRSVLPRSEFYRNYDLTDFGGKIIVKPEDFMSEEDKKRDAKFLMYFQQEADLIYYGSYSEKNATGKDLYFIQKLPTGGWSEPSKLSDVINTPYDEDYPFIHPEGNTLYFASKGHNSMGGYDIFKSTRRGDGTWSAATNMEFAINTPWDDFMFISDLEESTAWFASNRETSNKQVTVYRIGMERIPLDLTLIKGVFEYDGSKKATITVEDMIQNKKIGVYTADRQFGNYLLDLKGSGKYKFLVEAEESDAIHSGIVEVPREKGLKQFRQEMKLVMVDGQEQLQIINHFDDPIEDEQLLTAEILKRQASLTVNASEDELERSVELLDESKDASAGSKMDDAPREEKLALAQRAIRTLEEETQMLNAKASTLYDVAQQKKSSSDSKEVAEAAIAAELASNYRKEAERREVALNQMNSTLNVLESNSIEDAAFNAQYTQLAATKNNFKSQENFEEDLKKNFEKRLDPTISEYESKRAEVEDLESDLTAIDEEVAYYRQEIENTKDDLIKEELETQIQEAEASKPEKEASLDRASKELVTLVQQKNNALAYFDATKDLLDLAETYADPNLVKVNITSLNQLQGELNEKAKNDPALLAFVAPKEASLAMEESLSESRKSPSPGTTGVNGSNDDLTSTQNNANVSNPENSSGTPSQSTNDINDQIKAIEASESTPDVVRGDLATHFTKEIEAAGNAEDPIIAESRKAELYDSWSENIGLRIDSLQEAKRQESNRRKLVDIDDQIQELEDEKAAKERLAMQSYQNIANLSDQAANTAVADRGNSSNNANTPTLPNDGSASPATSDATTSTGDNNSTSLDEARSEGLPPSVVSVNKQFQADLESLPPLNANSSAEDKMKRAQVYQAWSDSLSSELAFYGELIQNAEGIEERNDLEQLAQEIAAFRMEVDGQAKDIAASVDDAQMAEAINASQGSLQQQIYEYVENYNASAFQQIENQVLNNPNEVIRKAELETLNKNWMIALQNERVKTEARIANTSDPAQQKALSDKLADLNKQKERVQIALDSLNPSLAVNGPSAPSNVMVKGSERFEGYVPVENPVAEIYATEAATRSASRDQAKGQVESLETELAETKKKKKRREIQEQLNAKERQLNILQMESAYYQEAEQKLSSVETQVLTMSASDPLPSEKQETLAASLKTEADNMSQNARTALQNAEDIRKKKERLPAIAEAERMQGDAMVMQQKANLAASLAEEMKEIEKATIEQNFIILPGQEVVLPTSERTLNPNEKEDVRFTIEYLDYNDQKVIADSIRREVAKIKQLEAQFSGRGRSLLERSATAPLEDPNGNSRVALANQAYEDFERSDSLSTLVAQLTRKATFIENEANRQLLARPEEAYLNVLAFYNDEPKADLVAEDVSLPPVPEQIDLSQGNADTSSQEPAVDPLNQAEAFKLNAPVAQDNSRLQVQEDVLTQTIFEIEEESPASNYSEANPIPVDPPLPTGLLYKVQIGAFRNAIRQDAFKGISPIVGESTNQGFIRYSAGEFKGFTQADAAKVKIQGIGYRDAFVVAYLNGQRIPITQARAVEGGAPIAAITPQATQGGTRPATRAPVQTQFIQQGSLEIQAVENIPGSFYTVQVGVYSKPVGSADIFNITPLMQENLNRGLYRYTTGKFDNEADATRARDEARALGISDAFVTAYRDGVRVAVEQIRGTTGGTATPIRTAPQPSAGGSFRIKLGTYTGDVPVQQASQLLMLSSEGVNKVTNADGSSSYYYGSFSSQAEADQRAQELRSKGLIQAAPEKL
ncbi:MAG: hypothetical protein RLP15_00350 [Cryomorphaceae bacterium]